MEPPEQQPGTMSFELSRLRPSQPIQWLAFIGVFTGLLAGFMFAWVGLSGAGWLASFFLAIVAVGLLAGTHEALHMLVFRVAGQPIRLSWNWRRMTVCVTAPGSQLTRKQALTCLLLPLIWLPIGLGLLFAGTTPALGIGLMLVIYVPITSSSDVRIARAVKRLVGPDDFYEDTPTGFAVRRARPLSHSTISPDASR